jgi:putative nucleotidyltransferase with HDIG domain
VFLAPEREGRAGSGRPELSSMSVQFSPVIPDRVIAAIDNLSPLPATARKLIAAMTGEDIALREVTRLIEFDQAIAAAVLRTARSAAYAGYAPPDTVFEAVMRLGTLKLLNLVMQHYVQKVAHDVPLYDLGQQELWHHGAAAELAVRALIQERPRAGIPPLAQTAALLHDLGKLVMSQAFNVDYHAVLEYAQNQHVTFVDAERELLGTDHAAIGGAIASRWEFPDIVADAICRHHEPHLGQSTVVLDAVVVANLVAKTIEVGLGAEGLNFALDVAAFQRLRLDFAAFGRVCLLADTWLKELPA